MPANGDKTRSLAIGIHMTGLYMGQALGGFGATIASAFSWKAAFHTFGLNLLRLELKHTPLKNNF